jgi:hypothetical protein
MAIWEKILRSNFLIKFRNWEYWPFGIVQFPLFIYYAWLSLRARSLVFFSASNPGIAMGGMFSESKHDVIKKIPQQYIPRTILIQAPVTKDQVVEILKKHDLHLPLIFKPELGERGYQVKRIASEADIALYLSQVRFNFLVQEFVDLPLEFGIFYTRFPHEPEGKVTSVVMKEMLSVTGDGQSTLQTLILQKDRAKLQWEKLKEMYNGRLHNIIPHGEKIELVSIGNHCLGTKFIDGNYLINDTLSATFDQLSQQIDGFYFGRFDLRCASIGDLYKGNIKIMELNGCGAEPAHIYHPGYPLRKALGVLFIHWRTIFLIARENVRRGASYTPLREAVGNYKKFKAATQS